MWKVVGCSVRGISHTRTELPCQDFCDYWQCQLGNEPVLLIGISDGAGSAIQAHIGSRETVCCLMREAVISGLRIEDITANNVAEWMQNTLRHLENIANIEKVGQSELACTAMLAILGVQQAVFAQIGDGAWVVKRQNTIEAATWPIMGEYANQTKFITSPNALEFLQFKTYAGELTGVAGFTDGIQSLALKYADKSVHGPFFESIFTDLNNCEDPTSLKAPLMSFLSSDSVNERTDDDKTLVIANRCLDSTCQDVVD